jgi:hypothetical protein
MIAMMVPNCTPKLTNLLKLQDLMCLNVERNFGMSSLLRDAILLCRVLRWGIESDYASELYDIVVGVNVVALPYDPVVLARTLHALIGPWTRVYISGKAQLMGPHTAFKGEMARPFTRVRRVYGPCSWLRSPSIFIIVADGKR